MTEERITIRTTTHEAFEALSTRAGIRGWWSTTAEVDGEPGGELRLHFDKGDRPVRMRFRIDEHAPGERVRWTCVDHDHAAWVGTTVTWSLRAEGDRVVVEMTHAGWKEPLPPPVVQGWKHFAASLAAYLETGTGQPS